jgi:hypothetical protein
MEITAFAAIISPSGTSVNLCSRKIAPNVLFRRTIRSFSSHQMFFLIAPNVRDKGRTQYIERKKRNSTK